MRKNNHQNIHRETSKEYQEINSKAQEERFLELQCFRRERHHKYLTILTGIVSFKVKTLQEFV